MLLYRRGVGIPGGGGGSTAMSFVTASTAQQYITTTWGHTPTDATRVTISYWEKFSSVPTTGYAYTTGPSSSIIFNHFYNGFQNRLAINDDGAGSTFAVQTQAGYNPGTSNWHHHLVSIDTNQATASNRVHIYIDGVEPTYDTTSYPGSAANMQVTANGIASYIGEVSYAVGSPSGIPDAKFAYFYLIDGQALTPSSFTTGTGVGTIHPISYAGTYGQNGFFLNGNGSSLTDAGPNGIVWTAPNGITFSSDIPT